MGAGWQIQPEIHEHGQPAGQAGPLEGTGHFDQLPGHDVLRDVLHVVPTAQT